MGEKKLTKQQRLHNALGIQKVEEYKARHAYLHAVAYQREEFDTFWHKSDNTTWTHQFGLMAGWDEIYYNSVVHTEVDISHMHSEMMKTWEHLRGHDFRGVGMAGCHALASEVVEAADDGLSVRAYYLTPGTLMGPIGFDGKTRGGFWLWERYGSEFVFVDGEWKWFHEQVAPDVAGFYDCDNWAHDRYVQYVEGTLNIGDLGGYPDRLTEPGTTHSDYSIVQTVQDTLPPPLPYETLDDGHTYSPGRTDVTGKVTVKTSGSQKMQYDKKLFELDLDAPDGAPPGGAGGSDGAGGAG
jgi:hypothetical protein